MCANRISTFLRSRRDCSKASVLASTRTRSCAVAFPGGKGIRIPIRRMAWDCCAGAATGHAAARQELL